jgi:hypothetical protein
MPRFFSKDRGIFLLYRNVGAIKPLLVQEEISMKMFASKQNSISLLAPFKPGKRKRRDNRSQGADSRLFSGLAKRGRSNFDQDKSTT